MIRSQRLSFIFISVFGMPLAALAASGHHELSFSQVLPFIPNFIVFLVLFVWLLGPKLSAFWASRRAELQNQVEAGKRALEDAEARLEKARELFSTIDTKIAQVKQSIDLETKQEEQQLREDARHRIRRILEQSDATIEGERRALESVVRDEIASKAIQRAKEKLERALNPDVDRQLRKQGMQAVSSLAQATSVQGAGK